MEIDRLKSQAVPLNSETSPRLNVETEFQSSLQLKATDTVSLSWHHLNFSATAIKPGEEKKPPWKKRDKYQKTILKDVSGIAKPGQFVAIMGPSGAGKTSLINILAGRTVKNTTLTGEMLMNGTAYDARKIKTVSGYVLQDDLLLPYLSVRECIAFSAMLRLPPSMPKEEKLRKVEAVITELNLVKCANTPIGNQFVRGVSGGERKRTAIGVELVTDPSVLFLDEPTTGLDSHTALGMVHTLKALAKTGRTIITTIHQPSSAIFQDFDVLLLMSRGEIGYFGPAAAATPYFAALGYQAPLLSNPADYFLDVLSDDARSEEAREASEKRVSFLLESYRNSKLAQAAAEKPPATSVEWTGRKTLATWWNQFTALTRRAARNAYRDRLMTFTRLGQNVVLGIVIGLIYLQMSHNQKSVGDRFGVLFFLMLNQGFGAMFTAITIFPQEKKVVMRERRAGMYTVSPYYFSKWVTELPLQASFPLLVATIAYWMIGLQPVFSKYLIFCLAILASAACSEALGLFVSVLVPNPAAAAALGPTIMILFILFSGLFINVTSIPGYFVWIAYISFVRWGFQAVVVNEFSGLHLYCKPGEFTRNGTCPLSRGEDAIRMLNFHQQSIGACIGILLGMVFVYRLLAYVFLRVRKE